MLVTRTLAIVAIGAVGLVSATNSVDSLSSVEFFLPRAYPGYLTPDGRVVRIPESALGRREDGPSTAELIKACPGAGDGGSLGNKGLTKAHMCGLIHKQQAGPSHSKLYEMDYPSGLPKENRNCDSTAGAPMVSTLEATKTVTQTWSFKLSIDTESGISKIFSVTTGVSMGYGHSNSTATTEGQKISVPAGQRCTWASTTWLNPMTGTMVVNFGEHDKVFGHWYWMVDGVTTDDLYGEQLVGPYCKPCSDTSDFIFDQ